MKKFIIEFIKQHELAIDDENFIRVYMDAYEIFSERNEVESISLLTDMFEEAGIKPLEYMNFIPSYYKSDSTITQFVVPSTIKAIMADAFHNCTKLSAVRLPKTVKLIDKNAFRRCKSLQFIIYDGEPLDFMNINFSNLKDCCHPKLRVRCIDGTIINLGEGYNTNIII